MGRWTPDTDSQNSATLSGDSILFGGEQPRAENRAQDSEEKNQRDGGAQRQSNQTTAPVQVHCAHQFCIMTLKILRKLL